MIAGSTSPIQRRRLFLGSDYGDVELTYYPFTRQNAVALAICPSPFPDAGTARTWLDANDIRDLRRMLKKALKKLEAQQ